MTKEQQRALLQHLTYLGYGQAEAEHAERFERRFLPIPEHARAFEPEVTLIVGERGSGKSALFRAVFEKDLLETIARHAAAVRLPHASAHRVRWLPAYPAGREFPDGPGLERFREHEPANPQRADELWFAYLVRVLADEFAPPHRAAIAPIMAPPAADPLAVHTSFLEVGTAALVALDDLDRRLEADDHWLFAGYDELDTLGGFDVATMSWAIRGLVDFWARYTRRWKRLRAKIFIRSDLFRRHAGLGSADLPKLAANRAELRWSDRNLLAMLIKRVANTNDALKAYCEPARISFDDDGRLGWIPRLRDADAARPLVERMIGPYMGANAKKGLSFRWILDHVRDGHGHAAPRALVRLFELAARKELDVPRQTPPRLLHPTALRLALEDVSRDHVLQAVNNEWPWLHGVKARMAGRQVPMERRALEALLADDWDGVWAPARNVSPPQPDARLLIDTLVELGVLRERPNDRLDVPDLFLFGLELRRKGGVATR